MNVPKRDLVHQQLLFQLFSIGLNRRRLTNSQSRIRHQNDKHISVGLSDIKQIVGLQCNKVSRFTNHIINCLYTECDISKICSHNAYGPCMLVYSTHSDFGRLKHLPIPGHKRQDKHFLFHGCSIRLKWYCNAQTELKIKSLKLKELTVRLNTRIFLVKSSDAILASVLTVHSLG